jgi:hypothetical protein
VKILWQRSLAPWLLVGAFGAGCHNGQQVSLSSGLPVLAAVPQDGVKVSFPDSATVDLDFGTVVIGHQQVVTLTIANQGIAVLTLGHAKEAPVDTQFDLQVIQGTQIYSTDGPHEVRAIFAPYKPGLHAVTFSLDTDSAEASTITVHMVGRGTAFSLKAEPHDLNFGPVPVLTTVSRDVTVTNVSTDLLPLIISQPKGRDAALFTVAPRLLQLQGNASALVHVTYSPQAATLDQSTAYFYVGLACPNCVIVVGLRGQPLTSGVTASPANLDFGFILPVGQSITREVRLTNQAPFAISVLQPIIASGGPEFSVPVLQKLVIPPDNGEVVIPVTFVPTAIGAYSGLLSVTTSDVNQNGPMQIPLTGYGGGPRIECTPLSLNFGQAAVGFPVSQRVTCQNVGASISGHPEADLIFQVATTGPGFSATASQLSLGSGQSATIDVVFSPTAAGPASGDLLITSNDSDRPSMDVPLSAQGLNFAPCVLSVVSSLDFSNVSPGATSDRQIALINAGSDSCLLTDLDLAPASAAVFSLPDGPIATAILGSAGNSAGTPSEIDVRVQFAPVVAGASFSAELDFKISDPTAPNRVLGIQGNSEPGCVVTLQDPIDLGRVSGTAATGCQSLPRTVQLRNVCDFPVYVGAIAVDDGPNAAPDFEISGLSTPLPAQLASASSGGPPLSFQVAFTPQGFGARISALKVRESDLLQPYAVELRGDAEAGGPAVDHFVARAPMLDVLFVVDVDDDPLILLNLTDNVASLLATLRSQGVDFRIAVTTTDVCGTAISEDGWFEPCEHCQQVGPTASLVGANMTAAIQAQTLTTLLTLAALWPSCNDEQFLEAGFLSMDRVLLLAHNRGLLRPGAQLMVVAVNGDGEDDQSPRSLSTYLNRLREAVDGDPARVSLVYMGEGVSVATSARLSLLAGATQTQGGLMTDFAGPTWLQDFKNSWSTALAQPALYPLTSNPTDPNPFDAQVHPNGIKLDRNGQSEPATVGPTQRWHYDPAHNAIALDPAFTSAGGDALTATYAVQCGG